MHPIWMHPSFATINAPWKAIGDSPNAWVPALACASPGSVIIRGMSQGMEESSLSLCLSHYKSGFQTHT